MTHPLTDPDDPRFAKAVLLCLAALSSSPRQTLAAMFDLLARQFDKRALGRALARLCSVLPKVAGSSCSLDSLDDMCHKFHMEVVVLDLVRVLFSLVNYY